MRRKRDYTDYVRDILDAAQKAERFIAGVEFEAFQANDEKVFAVIRALEIIGGSGYTNSTCAPCTLSRSALARGGRYAQQADPRLFWCAHQTSLGNCAARLASLRSHNSPHVGSAGA